MQEEVLGTRECEIFLDKNVVVQMYDGQLLYGVLRSFDQFNNITLENCLLRVFKNQMYYQKPLGLQMIRGENIIFFGITRLNIQEFQRVDSLEQLEDPNFKKTIPKPQEKRNITQEEKTSGTFERRLPFKRR